MAAPSFKEKVYLELVRVTASLSSPKRMEIIDALSQRDHTVEELAREIRMSVAATSRHLQVLKEARMVEAERSGRFIRYGIPDDRVLRAISAIRDLGFARLAEIGRIREWQHNGKDDGGIISLKEVAGSKSGVKEKYLLLDVRPEEEFMSGHIKGAVSVPLSALSARLKELPRDREVVVYCRGPLCVMAEQAAEMLRKKKFRVCRMEEGYTDWKIRYGKAI